MEGEGDDVGDRVDGEAREDDPSARRREARSVRLAVHVSALRRLRQNGPTSRACSSCVHYFGAAKLQQEFQNFEVLEVYCPGESGRTIVTPQAGFGARFEEHHGALN